MIESIRLIWRKWFPKKLPKSVLNIRRLEKLLRKLGQPRVEAKRIAYEFFTPPKE